MSVLDKKILPKEYFFSKKKKRDKVLKATGIDIGEPPVIDKNNKIFFILVNAIINFLVVMGMVGCFVKSFNIKCNMFALWSASVTISICMSFFYYNTIVKILGYVGSLIIFLYGIFNYKYLIKGGFAYVCNNLMDFFEKELDLPVERSYDVYGYGEKFSVTVCLIFIIFSVMIMFNMAISETKAVALVILVTFPIVQMGMYFDVKVSILYFVMYIIGIIALIFFRNSRHYHMEYKKRKGYRVRYKKKKLIFDYTNDGKYSLSFLMLLAIMIIIVTIVFSTIFPQREYNKKDEYSQLKDNTMDFTKRLLLVGFWGMLSPNGGSAGGVGRSRMGQSKYVTLDYETDLLVTMPIEKNEDTVYLKNFNGTFYNDAYWETISEKEGDMVSLEDYGLSSEEAMELNRDMAELYQENEFIGEDKYIKVVNVAADANYAYIPYNAYGLMGDWNNAINDDELNATLYRNWYLNIRYMPFYHIDSVDEFRHKIDELHSEYIEKFSNSQQYKDSLIMDRLDKEEAYSEYVKDMYMEVPKDNIETISEFCEKYNLTKDSSNIVERLTQIFEEDYEYTLIPGVTPSNKEFVNYFLSEQKKGYCVYFATASTLIFRYLGIPARYTGGYVIQPSDFIDGKAKDVDMSEWIVGSEENFYNGVYEYEVNDSQAHAWVEIYIDGFGWLPVDTTPPTDDEEEEELTQENNGFMNFMTNTILTRETFKTVKNTTFGIVYGVFMITITTILMYIIIGVFVRRKRRNTNSVIKQYALLCRASKMIKISKDEKETYESFGKKLVMAEITSINVIEKINHIVEKEKYSSRCVDDEEIAFVKENVANIMNEIYSRLNVLRKFIYRYVKWL
jgi:hypothetical protein